MEKLIKTSILDYFNKIEDPRIDRKKQHSLLDIIVIAICATICGAKYWTDVEQFGIDRIDWLKQFLKLENGIPSHDTFGRIFSILDNSELQKVFIEWVTSVNKVTNGEIVSIDGKCLRGSYDKNSDKSAIYMVSAWADKNEAVLGQVKVDEKSNEITAIPKLLDLLALKGCIITIDAMGCQKNITKKIIEEEADYALAVKGNQNSLYSQIKSFFENGRETDFNNIIYTYHTTEDNNHGRYEIRDYWVFTELDWLNGAEKWTELNSICVTRSIRESKEYVSDEYRYYISSLKDSAERMAQIIRGHWGIENKLHWILDVAFNEDKSRIRKGKSSENTAIIRHIAANLLKKEKSIKKGIEGKMFRAAINPKYLEKVIFGN